MDHFFSDKLFTRVAATRKNLFIRSYYGRINYLPGAVAATRINLFIRSYYGRINYLSGGKSDAVTHVLTFFLIMSDVCSGRVGRWILMKLAPLERARREVKSLHRTFWLSTPGREGKIAQKVYFLQLNAKRTAPERNVFVSQKWSRSMQHQI